MSWLEGINDTYLRCRTLRHSWTIKGFEEAEAPKRATLNNHNQFVGRVMECEYCKVRRIDLFGRMRDRVSTGLFRRVSTRYVYPEDYQFNSTDGDKPAFIDYTNEALHRALPKEYERGSG